MKTIFLLPTAFLLFFLSSCREEKQPAVPAPPPAKLQTEAVQVSQPPPPPGCRTCHADIQLDPPHDFACMVCHQGNNDTNDRQAAHQGLNVRPAAPENMAAACGRCHEKQTETCGQSLHFTLSKEINLIRSQFGLAPMAGLKELPESSGPPQNKEQLVDDLLRRRCLRCHVQTAGDSYPYTQRGMGCAACHLSKTAEGKLDSHAISIPGERQCLSCHYGNRVGADFSGMHEHDYGSDFRSPQATKQPFLRPYGVEQHDLAQDIHRLRGLSCLDCHSGGELSGRQKAVTCADCHAPEPGTVPQLKNVQSENGQLILTVRQDGSRHPIPALKHPAHAQYGSKVACQVCHAQWSFNDQTTHLLLTYSAAVGPWEPLAVQSSSEAERFINNEEDPFMTDTLTGRKMPGIWLQGYSLRRWELLLIRRDKDGIIKVFRPLLDLRLSAADADGKIIAGLDNISGSGDGLLPYTPHTTGPAGLFYEQRFLRLLQDRPAPQR